MSSNPRPIKGKPRTLASAFGSFAAASPLAQASIERDIQEDPEDAVQDPEYADGNDDGSGAPLTKSYSMTASYRRSSFIAAGSRRSILATLAMPESGHANKKERDAAREDERSLLRDNKVIPPKHPQNFDVGRRKSEARSTRRQIPIDEEAARGNETDGEPSEETPLILNPDLPYGGQDTPENIDKKWVEAVSEGKIHTTWQREAKVIGKYSRSLILTFLLQYSLPMASVFTVGHLGTVELGAVSLGSMTASITGYAVYQGLATSLDTLCAQAYGSGRKKLVGLQTQRMILFLWTITIPIGIIWMCGTQILEAIIPEKETARLAGLYLKVLLAGAPGYAAFEAGKRFVQAQGIFSATLYVLLIVAPLNAFLSWFLVWKLEMGFIGAPIAIVTTENLMPLLLFLYVYFIDGMECWGGFSKAAFRNWVPMVRLALPGLVMVLAEWLAFEMLTLSSSYLGSEYLAAQSVLNSLTAMTFQIPFPVSVAASTRIANLIGATLAPAAKISAKVGLVASVIIGVFNIIFLSTLRYQLPKLITSDERVIELVATIMPLCAAFQLFDAIAAMCNGILRGIGRQEIGGYVGLFSYYVVAVPVSLGLSFGLHWGLWGLWGKSLPST